MASSSFAQYTKLLDFGSTANGTHPYSSPISDGTFLYGMTSDGGLNGLGTIYKVKLDGTGFTKLLDFDGTNGRNPFGSLTLAGSTLVGMTRGGGANGQGTIFKINSDGTGYTDLMDFAYAASGGFPYGSLIFDGTFLYGMTTQGGSKSYGTVFKILLDGTGYTKLLEFDNTNNGGYPYGSLISDGTFLYGMTTLDGAFDYGTIFKIKTDGTGYAKLRNFGGAADGKAPYGSLISDGTFLYGMTSQGGANNFGALFKIKPDGTSFTKLVDFDNSTKGAYPTGSLVSDGTFLYGTTTSYGLNDRGTIFKVKTDGTGYAKLFDNDVGINGGISSEGTLLIIGSTLYGAKSGGGAGVPPFFPGAVFRINTDGTGYTKLLFFETEGSNPSGSLYSDGTFQYGMTSTGGLLNYGTIFKIKPDGTGFVRLLDFDGPVKGSNPKGSLISDGIFLYGMTTQGGSNGAGTIFKIKPDGTGFVKLFNFAYATSGGASNGSLIFDGTFLYGMTGSGASNFYGAIFKIKPDGTGFSKLLDFDGVKGGTPNGSLISDGTFLHGMSASGGTNGFGTLFKIKPDGTGFLKLLDFDYTNNGSNPKGDLLYDGVFLYGMTSNGPAGKGSIFKIKSDGAGYAKLKDFGNGGSEGSLISDGTFLYGMTYIDGSLSKGTLFKIKPDGTSHAILTDFNEGSNPLGSLISDGTFLYGMTQNGGANSSGVLFKSTLIPFVSITDFIPANGVEGTYITINGNNFDLTPANNIVKFNGTTAVVTASTSSTLTVIVPVGSTSGPISVTAGTTDTSTSDFTVDNDAVMVNVTVQNCNVTFLPPTYAYTSSHGDMATETFIPVNPADKVKITFSTFNVTGGDVLYVHDGPTSASPLLATLTGITVPADIVATGPGGELTFLYSWGDGSTNWNATISCQSTGGSTITITTQPSDFIACVGQSATFTTAATGTTNITHQWQYSPNTSPLNFIDISNGGGYSNTKTATLSVNTTGNFGAGRYRCKISGDNAATVFTNDEGLFINSVPSSPTVNGSSICGNGSVTLTAAGGTNGQYKWYSVATGGTPISGEVNSSYATPSITTTTIYYATLTSGGCESTRTPGTATINLLSTPPAVTGGSACGTSKITLTASGGTNGQYTWYTVATGGTAITGEVNSSYVTPLLSTTTTYYVTITIGTCESTRTAVIATVTTPIAPTANGSSACPGSTFVLTATGGTNGQYKWYTVATGGTTIAGEINSSYTTPSLSVTTTYYATTSTAGCESTRTPVTATILTTGCAPVITTASQSTQIEGKVEFDLNKLITTPGTLDPNSIKIIKQPTSGAVATISNGVLIIDYKGKPFSGIESITIEACNTNGICSQQTFTIEVAGDVVVYNAVSPNGDKLNDFLRLEYIQALSAQNQVTIYNRWGDEVFSISDYDNDTRRFEGFTNGGSKLPVGTYFYKINLLAMGKTITGYLDLKY
ncbi:MAG: choice-of-anchor tandem repeat GloVer-containing protein [Cyclobacteriaceae bacterium]